MAVDVGSAVGYLDLDISGFLNSLKTAQSEAASASQNMATQIGNKFSGVGKSLTTAGKKLSTVVTAPVVGLGAASIKTTADFESAMSKVSAISGATGNDLDTLSKKAKEMGAKTKFSATESAEAFTYMAMAGWKTEDMIDGIDGIMSLAAADGLDLATTSDIVTDALTAFGLSAEDSGHFADVLAKASSSANTNVSMLGESFKYVAPVAGSLGYSAEDTAIALGLMANAGIKGSQAGTALRGSISRLVKPTGDAAAMMDKYGISLTNADGTMKPLGEVMDELREKLGGLSESEQAQAATTLFGQEAMSGMLAIINASDSDYKNLTDSIYNAEGAAQKMADVQLDNLSGQITILKSALEGAAIQIGELLLPYVKDFVQWIQNLIDKFNSLSPEQQNFIVKIALMAAVIGPILLIIGKLTSGIGNLITNVGKITSLFGKFGSAASSAAGPAASAAKGVGGLAKSATGLLAAGAGILLASAGLALLAVSAVKLAEAGWPAIAVMGGLVIALAGLAVGAAAIAPALTAGAVGLAAFGAAITLVGVGILAATSGVALLATQLPVISKYGAQAADNILNLGESMISFGAGATVTGAGLTAIGIGATSAAAGIALLGVGVLALTAGMIALGAGFVVCGAGLAIISVAMKSTATSVKSIEESAGKAAKSLKNMIKSVDVVKAGFNGLNTIVTKAVKTITSIFTSSGPKVSASALSMSKGITKNMNTGLMPIPKNTTEIMTQMNKAITSGMSKMNKTIRYGFNSSVSYIRSLSNQSYSWGSDMISGIIRGIKSKYGAVSSAVNGVANIIHSRLHFSRPDEGPLRDYETWMPDFMEGLAKGINNNSHLVKSAIQNVASDMKLDNIDTHKTEVFTKDDAENLKTYNITLINTIGLYKQLIEQMRAYSQYSGIVSGDNNLLGNIINKTEEKAPEKPQDNSEDKDKNKPDVLNIPISIGEEQLETVVVDLLRREVRV